MRNSRDQYKKSIFYLEVFVILIIFTAFFAITWYQVLAPHVAITFFRRGHWAVIAFYALIFLMFAKLFGGFRIGTARRTDLLFSYIANLIFTNGILYLITVALTLNYGIYIVYIYIFIIELVIVVVWVYLISMINRILFPPHNMLMIHGDYQQKDVILTINQQSNRYSIRESVNINLGLEAIKPKIDQYDSVVVSDVPAENRNDVLKYCYETGKRIYMLPKITDIIIRSADEIHIFDTPVMLARNYGLSFEHKLFKRIGDIIVSGIGIILTAIPAAVIAILIKVKEGGPIIFKQDRLTRDGKVFRILKFRTMYTDAEKQGAQLARKYDDRITPIGRVLRRSHLDEIPQLINVFKGDMSIVGPRPERPEIMNQYIDNIAEFNYRLKVKGGLTGYAQVYGKYNTTPYNKLRLDLAYIQNYSIFLDIKIMVLTAKILFKKETSEGVGDDQITALKKGEDA